tara:strand:- start:249 stop:401 length:153 start_codon:yes stop_codon:yes gene_type:complete
MDNWLNSLSVKELRTWIKHMTSLPILFFATDEEKQNIELAKEILKSKLKN